MSILVILLCHECKNGAGATNVSATNVSATNVSANASIGAH